MPRAKKQPAKPSLERATRAQLVHATERALALVFAYDAYMDAMFTASPRRDSLTAGRYRRAREDLREALGAAYGRGPKKTKGAT